MHPRSSSTDVFARTLNPEPLEGGAVFKTQRVGTKPTTRTYIGQAPILGYADIVNEENRVYPFFKKDEKVPIIDTHVNSYDPYHVPVPGAYAPWTPHPGYGCPSQIGHAPYHYPGCNCPSCSSSGTLKLMETKLEGLKKRNSLINEKIEKAKEARMKQANENEIKKLELLKEKIKLDKERRAELQAKKDKIFSEDDMALMQQMQLQQKGLHKLIQEFRESNADKLLDENQQLQDRLYRLEMEDRSINDRGYMTMPEPKEIHKKLRKKKNSTIVYANNGKKVKKDKEFWKSHKPHYQSMPQIHYDPGYDAMLGSQIGRGMPPQANRGSDRYTEYVNADEYNNPKHGNKMSKDQGGNYFLPPIPNTARMNNMLKSYAGPGGRMLD